MIRIALLWLLMAMPLAAQDLVGLARLDVAQSGVEDLGTGLEAKLYLSQPVPWRVFTLDGPPRLVMDFREIDWRGATRAGLLNADNATDLRFGTLRPGWSRMEVDLAGPLGLDSAEMVVDDVTGTALVRVRVAPVSAEAFADASAPREDPDWMQGKVVAAAPAVTDGPLVVAIDPGHGGIDPGAVREGASEADLMLQLGLELAEAVARAGMVPVLTRRDDSFVSVVDRSTIARNAGADVFLSLHADALTEENARGASIYTLSEEARDQASQRMAELHERGDLLPGSDLTAQDDTITAILMDLTRLETVPRSEKLADALVAGLRGKGARLNSRPRRMAMLAVLLAPDMPSVLIETGFLSDPGDREELASAAGRQRIIDGLLSGVTAWALEDDAMRDLLRR